MVYFKTLLNDKRPKADNIYPVVVRVTYDRNNTTLTTGIRVASNLWDNNAYKIKHNHPNAQTLNKSISDFYSKVQNEALKLIDERLFSFEELKNRLSAGYEPVKPPKPIYFKQYADELIADMYSINKVGNAIIYQTATNRLMSYVDNRPLPFTEINYTLLDGFRNALIKDKVKQNTISNYFRTLRAIYNKAIKAKLVDRSHYPFLDISIKTERTAKRALQIGDLIKLATVDIKPSTPMWNARNYFFLSFGLIGISFTDLAYLKQDSIKKGRLKYARKKTGTQLCILLQPYPLRLLTSYNLHDTDYLIPVLPNGIVEGSKSAKRIIGQWIKTTNKYLSRLAELCNIDAEITSYVARHSWATTAKRLGYSNEMIAEAMGHEYGNKITNIYLDNFDQTLIDEMNAEVIESIV
jgi:integrase/recombinase XerD